ncbi:MAG: type IV pili twitching motility protein PilT [Candidatus Lloydbacteria bacterium CG22_combo_CG10-13_8_21_14_all_47_15]|uniref:Type IV pili twitching motility protein PilT n=1 Tax=Candidatus Lloydbacteria bacterium CG22_combo_CG10-13_8_21_14_all_47_15 TaxID=1974635 RepID=A0A2H0CVP8_9BACT|nr:MAG: type IV pili twitching motility protein PilT [Candidatus Lloydbacteria bacterium CG22_combo_CG10-13_8_21_14_all_47_15]
MDNYAKELSDLLGTVVREGGSDLHLSVGRFPTIRVSGQMIPLTTKIKLSPDDTRGLLYAMLSEEHQATFNSEWELDFAYTFEGSARFRGNAFLQQGNIGIALRLIPKDIRTLKELSLPPILETFARKKQGFFLVVGPVGQGKSTTLASLLNLVNKERAEHIITIEDPVEYLFEEDKSIVDQREVRTDTKDFASALRSMFRQDVNIAMIGEMRGPLTMATAVTAAETGHLIFSTLHTNNAAQTIDRIIDSFPPTQQGQIKVQLAGSLLGIFSQRLVPRISGGLIPAYELLINNYAVANLIREGRTHEIDVVIETSARDGMIPMNRSLADLVRAGEISPENAYIHSLNPRGLEKLL